VEAEVKAEDVLKRLASDLAHGPLAHAGEDGVEQFAEQGGADPGCAVCARRVSCDEDVEKRSPYSPVSRTPQLPRRSKRR
jgi:hypothetical protein